jgi:hypothetical protein
MQQANTTLQEGKGNCLVIGISIPADRSAVKKEAEEVLKQKRSNSHMTHVECELRGNTNN